MDDNQDQTSATGPEHLIEKPEALNFDRLKETLIKLDPQFKYEICLQDQFFLKHATNDVSAACLPFYHLKNPSDALGVRFFIQFMCMTCGNTKLLDREFLEKRLAHEG